jgi:hypothetical protein
MVVGKTSEKQRLCNKLVDRLRERNVRMQLQQLFRQQEETDWRAGVAEVFKKDLNNMARAYKNEYSKARFKDAAVQSSC